MLTRFLLSYFPPYQVAQDSQTPNWAVNICMKNPLGSMPSALSMSFSVASAQFSNLLESGLCQALRSQIFYLPCHFPTPNIEAKSDEESRSEGHAAHEDAGDDVNEGAEEAAVLVLVEEHADPKM